MSDREHAGDRSGRGRRRFLRIRLTRMKFGKSKKNPAAFREVESAPKFYCRAGLRGPSRPGCGLCRAQSGCRYPLRG